MKTAIWDNDVATPDPGEYDELTCSLCASKMDVTRDVIGPRSFAGAMAGISRRHDFFKCPHREDKWHKQAMELRSLANETPSQKLADIYLSEVAEIVLSRKPTKE